MAVISLRKIFVDRFRICSWRNGFAMLSTMRRAYMQTRIDTVPSCSLVVAGSVRHPPFGVFNIEQTDL
jgi:hypothetical protein